ncbi:MAG: chemotaxis protein CheW [Pseudomonadota bacterium]|nr:chemotaxis protein CheW [Pseudomonadota bacterium]
MHQASESNADTSADDAEALSQYLTFQLGEGIFALEIRGVREIIQICPMTAVPLMPSFVRGVINLRGAVVPVIDLRARFGQPPAVLSKKSCIVIFNCSVGMESLDLGLLVDAVNEVLDIPADMIEPAPQFGTSVRRDFIRGMGKLDQRFAIILEPSKAFDVGDLESLCTATQAQPVN